MDTPSRPPARPPSRPWRPDFYPPGYPQGLDLLVDLADAPANAPGRPLAIACTTKRDGGGSQVHAQMSARAFCAALGYTYAHLPLVRVQHADGPDFDARWEARFRLGLGAPLADTFGCPVVPAARYAADPDLRATPAVVTLQNLHAWTDANTWAYDLIRDDLRQRYAGAGSAPRAVGEPLRVALHVRRGDVTAGGSPHRFTENEEVQIRVATLQRELYAADREAAITVYSEGDPEDFDDLAAMGCALSLNGDPLAAIDAMVAADILMTAKSSFSHVAALISRGLIIHEPYWHAPQDGWVDVNEMDDLADRIAGLPG